ncbi:MAG: RNA polymerase sigma factor [Acidobacteriota bacterium]
MPEFVSELDALMLRYQQADPAATTELIRQVSPLLFRFLLNQSRDRPEAEDLLQDTWLRIHKSRHTHRPGEPVLPWMFAIARHVKVDGFRRSYRIRSKELTMSELPEIAQPTTSRASTPDFDSLIAALPASQREVVCMLKVSGMSLEEVARATSSTVGSVKLKAHRAYEKLRSILRSSDDVV